ncbi:hypothetical protein, partial [Prevotella pallens]|uniref:hypothetical protein n=1 Tax=Prevotella pallens TaxID=60133 RepID=UPI0023F17F19
ILETKERKMNKIKREEREDLHTFSDTTITFLLLSVHSYLETMLSLCFRVKHNKTQNKFLINTI